MVNSLLAEIVVLAHQFQTLYFHMNFVPPSETLEFWNLVVVETVLFNVIMLLTDCLKQYPRGIYWFWYAWGVSAMLLLALRLKLFSDLTYLEVQKNINFLLIFLVWILSILYSQHNAIYWLVSICQPTNSRNRFFSLVFSSIVYLGCSTSRHLHQNCTSILSCLSI